MEAINLNLIPNGTNPVVHCSQYDEGREFRFNLFDGASVFVLDGTEDISCDIKKPDGNIVTAAVPNTEDDYIIVTTTLQMTACSGNSLGTINISKGGINLYTLNFVLYCERSPLENGIESESSIHNLESMVDGMVAEEVAEQYDSANVIFDNEPTDNHGIGYTVTSEGIKTAIDNAFDYDNTASGSLVHITDGAENIPVKSLTSEIVAVESGNGQPKSPDNPYTISGFDSGIVSVYGKNFLDYNAWKSSTATTARATTVFQNNGVSVTATANDGYVFPSFRIPCVGGETYTLSWNSETNIAGLVYVFFDDNTFRYVQNGTQKLIFTVPIGTNGVRLRFGVAPAGQTINYSNIQVELGDTATDFESFNGNTYTFTFGQTVYGGYFDNKGNLVVTHKATTIDDLSFSYESGNTRFVTSISDLKPVGVRRTPFLTSTFYSVDDGRPIADVPDNSIYSSNTQTVYIKCLSYTDPIAFKTALTGAKIVYPIEPITLAITSQDIPTLLGENNIYSNCGDLEVNYYTSKSNDILEFVDSEIGKKNGTNIPIEENSQDSIKDYVDDEISSTKDYVDNGLSGKADTSDFTIEDLSSSVTLNSAFDTPDYKKMYKYGNVIHLMMRAKLNSNLANNSAVVTMPSRVAPKGNDYAQNLYYGTQYATTTPLNCYFGSFDNGLHTLGAISSGQYVMIDTMWITN